MTGRVRWMPAYLLAHIMPVLASTCVWIIVCAVQPLVIVVGLTVGVLALLLRSGPWVFRLRYGVRLATDTERGVVLAALVPAQSLRGRGQPRIWVGDLHGHLAGLSACDLAVDAGVLVAIVEGRFEPTTIAMEGERALAPYRVGASVARVVVAGYCLPWRLAAAVGGRFLDVTGLRTAWGLVWGLRPVIVVTAVVQQAAAGQWGLMVGIIVFGVLTYTTPFLTQRWRRCAARVGFAVDFDDKEVSDGRLRRTRESARSKPRTWR
jgi:hypothetical protein